MSEEIWKEVGEQFYTKYKFEGKWEASSLGNVRRNGKPLNTHARGAGYLAVNYYGINAHIVVAHAWCEGYAEGLEVNHINEVKDDNRPENLEWTTRSANLRHKGLNVRKGLKFQERIRTVGRTEAEKSADAVRGKKTSQFLTDPDNAKRVADIRKAQIKSRTERQKTQGLSEAEKRGVEKRTERQLAGNWTEAELAGRKSRSKKISHVFKCTNLETGATEECIAYKGLMEFTGLTIRVAKTLVERGTYKGFTVEVLK